MDKLEKLTCCELEENNKILWRWDREKECYEPDLIICELCKKIIKEI